MNFWDWQEAKGERTDEQSEFLAAAVIGAAIEVHKQLGPGLSESVYQKSLEHELTLRGIPFVVQHSVPVLYQGVSVGQGYIDLFVGGRLVVELKSVEALSETHRGQVIAYLSALRFPLGLLINFNVAALRQGLRRVICSRFLNPPKSE